MTVLSILNILSKLLFTIFRIFINISVFPMIAENKISSVIINTQRKTNKISS